MCARFCLVRMDEMVGKSNIILISNSTPTLTINCTREKVYGFLHMHVFHIKSVRRKRRKFSAHHTHILDDMKKCVRFPRNIIFVIIERTLFVVYLPSICMFQCLLFLVCVKVCVCVH